MEILIVADDLTGALDSAAVLAEVGLRCRVARRPADIPAALADRPEVLAVSTASREDGAGAAEAAIEAVFRAIQRRRPKLTFKKVDSRLKGHVGAELRAVAEHSGLDRALVAPAVPAQERFTVAGQVTGTGLRGPVDVGAACADSGLALAVPDTTSEDDLDKAIGEALAGPPTLLVGAAGLAAALGRHLRPRAVAAPVEALPPPLMLAIGSRDPITLAQVEAVRGKAELIELAVPDGDLLGIPTAEKSGALLVQLVPGDADRTPRDAGERFARGVAALFRERPIATLFSCGGETTDAILGALGVGVLEVEGQLLPGVPVSHVVVDGRAARWVSKSGGFGNSDTIRSVIEAAA